MVVSSVFLHRACSLAREDNLNVLFATFLALVLHLSARYPLGGEFQSVRRGLIGSIERE
jgi:hypothetical protein